MIDTRMTPGHEQARALALALASLRRDPPPGLEALASQTWDLLHSLTLSLSPDGEGIEIVLETMRRRQPRGTRTVLRVRLPSSHPCHSTIVDAVENISSERAGRLVYARVMIAFPGWEASVSMPTDGGEEVSTWGCQESLALTGAEWDDFIVQRDTDERERGMYAANALLRVAMRLEHMVASHPDDYYRHWTRVDAEILRRAALREHPSLDPDFVPRIALAA